MVQLYISQKQYLKKYKSQFKNILEIGFNAGHSSELFLDTNPNSVVTSIDLGYWYYCKFGIKYLEKKFPDRFQIILKDVYFKKVKYLLLYAFKHKDIPLSEILISHNIAPLVILIFFILLRFIHLILLPYFKSLISSKYL